VNLIRFLVPCAVLSAFTPHATRALVVDGNFTETPWVAGLSGVATSMAWAPDGSNRLFVTAQSGSVWVVVHGDIPTPASRDVRLFATISPIHWSGECGLLGLVFDPNFQVNHYVYFFVTVSASEQQIIRYTAEGDVGTNKTVIVAGLPTAGLNHNGGAIGIGPDGALYWGVGDQANRTGVNADLASLAAKIGRAYLDGGVPSDNPFFDGDGPWADYIWARGVRNPFSMTFQPATGALWVAVVGDNYEQAFIVRSGDHAGYYAHENNQSDGYITPILKYRTNGTDSRDLTTGGALRRASEVTFTTTVPHGFRRGELITVSGVSDASFNGDVFVASTPSATTFTAVQAGPDAASGNGTALTQALGGCITGGTFYAATQFPPAYWGNYFFGDFNSGNIMRAVLSSPTAIESVRIWATNIGQYIDIDTGPDGALYYMRTEGEVFRAVFDTAAQGLVVSRTHVWMSEGGEQSISVSLAIAPIGDVVVHIARAAGNHRIDVGAGATLTFTSANWNVPQPVTITSAIDANTLLDSAFLEVSATGLPTQSVTVNAIDTMEPDAAPTGPADAAAMGVADAAPAALPDAGPTGLQDAATAAAGDASAGMGLPRVDAAVISMIGDSSEADGNTPSGAREPSPSEDSGCACRAAGRPAAGGGAAWALLGALMLALRCGRRAIAEAASRYLRLLASRPASRRCARLQVERVRASSSAIGSTNARASSLQR
jgi:glucose/arabinose dehydrogenase